MKLISFIVCCYNSSAYMTKCLESLILGGKDIEIIIVDDGSTDETGKIADSYMTRYPNVIKVIHEENAGHGGAINNAIKEVTGLYFQIVDSDDWLDKDALVKLVSFIQAGKNLADLIVTDYNYCYIGKGTEERISLSKMLPSGRKCSWKDVKGIRYGNYFMIHSSVIKTEVYLKAGLILPKKTEYEDNLLIYGALGQVKSFYYLNVSMYRYLIGRKDQSISLSQSISHLDDHITVALQSFMTYDLKSIRKISYKQYKCLINQLRMIIFPSMMYSRLSKNKENYEKIRCLKKRMKEECPYLYKRSVTFSASFLVNIKGPLGYLIAKIASSKIDG